MGVMHFFLQFDLVFTDTIRCEIGSTHVCNLCYKQWPRTHRHYLCQVK